MSGIHWVASYPKSGNTWVRYLLANYFKAGDAPADGRDLRRLPTAGARALFDDTAGVAAADLTPAQVRAGRPRVYEHLARELPGPLFMKIHDAFAADPGGTATVTPQATRGVFYLVRNPLDVAVSLAFHAGIGFREAVARMGDPDFCLARCGDSLPSQLDQPLSTWSRHVAGWLDDSGLPLHLVRYEDLARAPRASFAAMLRFAGLAPDSRRVARAVACSSFDALRAQEARRAFLAAPSEHRPFFRAGQVAGWRRHLTPAQARRILADHGPTMARLGYLSPAGEPVF